MSEKPKSPPRLEKTPELAVDTTRGVQQSAPSSQWSSTVASSSFKAPPAVTTQAMRVVVCAGPHGLTIAQPGHATSAISFDAILVAVDPSVTLSDWLSEEEL